MADAEDSPFGDATAVENALDSQTVSDRNGASGQDGDNKFQKAISAWRSMTPFASVTAATDFFRHRPDIDDPNSR
jgi:hypothetical protein